MKPDPLVMEVRVSGEDHYVSGYKYTDLINRANERFGDEWEESKVMTQKEALCLSRR